MVTDGQNDPGTREFYQYGPLFSHEIGGNRVFKNISFKTADFEKICQNRVKFKIL